MVYLPLEAVQSKYYGEAERQLAAVFTACDALPGGCLLFLDEVDALATRRGGEMHEATRRSLSVLLRRMDSLEAAGRTVLVTATNRPQDLDPALLSRFDATVVFGLPDAAARAAIVRRFARQLADAEVQALAAATDGCSGRDLRDIAEAAERRTAAAIIRGALQEGALPGAQAYLAAAEERRAALALGGDA
jgi:SpoVK/Ycf46/Vps4 family AAA+-type ATPase